MLTRLTLTRIRSSCAASRAARPIIPAETALTCHRDIAIPLSFDPDLAIREVFFFPDRNQLLQAVDAFERRVECGLPVSGSDDHGDAGLADQQASQTVHHSDALDGIGERDLHADLGHHFE